MLGRTFIRGIHDLSAFKTVPKSNLYARIRVFNKPYLVTQGDRLTLPHNLKNVDVGLVVQFDDVVELGSRDVVLHADGPVEGVSVKGTVIEKTREKASVKVTEFKRNRKSKRCLVKPLRTVIQISEVDVRV